MTAPLTALTVPLDAAILTAALGDATADAGPAAAVADLPSFPSPLDLLRTEDALCWIRRGEGLVAFGEVARFTGTGPERFADGEAWWKQMLATAAVEDLVRLPGTGPLAFGSFAFSKTSPHPSRLIIPRIVAGFADGQAWLTQLTLDGGELTAEGAHAELGRQLARRSSATAAVVPEGQLATGSLSEQEWMDTVAEAVQAIEAGRLEKVVLARDIVARFAAPVSRAQILRSLAQRYSECWTYGVDGLVGSTPEMLIKIDGTTAQARVLAGTLDRVGAPADSDAFALRVLGGSQKQRQEHDFAVHSLTRQLAPFATDLSFPAEPFILELPNVWHLASDVTAELADAEGHLPTSLALVEALHPTAAVCGTPRTEAGELIRELEQLDRGPYAGPVGWMDGAGNGEWGIALRGAVVEDPQTVRLYAGCGIVEASDPAAELAETWAKFRPMLQSLDLHA